MKFSEKNNDSVIELIELTRNEIQLIKSIRHNWRFGEVVVIVSNGQPYRLKRVTEFIDLDTGRKT